MVLIRKAYVDDDFARGAELHKEVLAAREVYWPLEEKFMTALMTQEEEQRVSELKAMREEGLLIRAAMPEVVMAAQAVREELAGQKTTSKSLPKLNMEALRPSYDALNKGVTELEQAAAKEGGIGASIGDPEQFGRDLSLLITYYNSSN